MAEEVKRAHSEKVLLILLGDVGVFVLSLWLSLSFRHFARPDAETFLEHLVPFSLIFALWLIVYFIADLYGKQTIVFRKKLLKALLGAQLANSGLAVLIFYFVPGFGLTPKTILFINLGVTLALISLWRSFISARIYATEGEPTLVIGNGQSVNELKEALENHPQFGYKVANTNEEVTVASHSIESYIKENDISVVIVNMGDSSATAIASEMYDLLFTNVRMMDLIAVYEELYGREPLELLNDKWFFENISGKQKMLYTISKRLLDLSIAIPLSIVPIVAAPFIWLANTIEDGNKLGLFVLQERIGQDGQKVRIRKFRSMTGDDKGDAALKTKHVVTKVGAFLRTSRLDEFAQIFGVIKGEFSLIGPRPELPALVAEYEKSIPYYKVRHLVPPGITGWAQVYHQAHPHHGTAVRETAEKLSYDLYYIKNRSFILDLKIALSTVRTLLSRVGS